MRLPKVSATNYHKIITIFDKNLFVKSLITILFILFSFNFNFSQAIFSTTQDGSWSTPVSDPSSPWSLVSGIDSDGIPDGNDDVILNNVVTLPSSNINIGTILINVTGHLILNSQSYKLFIDKVNSTITNNGEVSGSGIIEIRQNVCTISGSGTWSSDIYFRINRNTIFDGVDLVLNSNFLLRLGGSATVNSNSSLSFNNKVFSSSFASRLNNYGTINLNTLDFFQPPYESSETCLINFPGSTFNYDISSANTGDFPIPSNAYYNLNINANADCDQNFSVLENWSNVSTFTSSSSGNVILFSGTTPQNFSGNGINNFKNIVLNNSNGITLSSGEINIQETMESLSGTFTQNGAEIKLLSNTDNFSGIIKVNSSSDYSYLSGNFVSQRYFNASSDGWRMISSPIQNVSLNEVDDEFPFCGIIPVTSGNYSYGGCGNFNSVLTFDETLNDYIGVTSINQSISSGNGTLIYTSSGIINLSISNNGTKSPNFANVDLNITKNSNGYNLVSNPYPSTIEWSSLKSANSIIQNAHWIYSGDAGNFISGTSNIPHSQSFFINANSAGQLSFNVNQTVSTQSNFVKTSNGINSPLKLKISSDSISYFDNAYVQVGSSFSNDYDSSFEISKFFSPIADYSPNIYFIDSLNNFLDRICINNSQSNSLFFDVKIGQYSQGEYSIKFENISEFMIGSCIILEDLHNGIITDLRSDSIYFFDSDTSSTHPRFKLDINIDYDINVSNLNCFNDSSGEILITGDSLNNSYFQLYDSSGLLIDSVNSILNSIRFTNLNSGNYTFMTNFQGRCITNNQNIIISEPKDIIADFIVPNDTVLIDTTNLDGIFFRNISSIANFFEWYFSDGSPSSTETSINHVFHNPGTYNITLVAKSDSIGTCSDTIVKTIVIVSNINNINELDDNNIIVQNGLIILTQPFKFEYIKIFSLNGNEIYNSRISRTLINPNLKKGIYILKFLTTDGEYITRKFSIF
jgi:hypothetical protein